jgi:hypothetical protein
MKLNGATIPDEIVARVVARRGSEHPYAELDPAKTALVVIDMQNAFMDSAVGHAVCPAAVDIVPAINRLAAASLDDPPYHLIGNGCAVQLHVSLLRVLPGCVEQLANDRGPVDLAWVGVDPAVVHR